MKYIKRIDEGWFSKKPKLEGLDFLYYLLDNYKSFKYLSADKSSNLYHIGGKLKGNDIQFFGIIMDTKEIMLDGDIVKKLSDKEYKKVSSKVEEIIEYLDEKENKSDSTIDDILNINPESDYDINVMKLEEEFNKKFKQYIGVPLKFDTSYRVWTSNSSNENKYGELSIVIKKINPVPPNFNTIDIFCELDGKDMYIQFHKGLVTEYMNPKEISKPGSPMVARLQDDETKLSRKELRDKNNNKKYPNVLYYSIVPSEWKSIELFKELKNILEEIERMNK